jgi:nucleoside-diphosphate-sugar epimerase
MMARYKMFVRSDKAIRELGYQPASARDALARAVEWLRSHHCA